MRRHNRHLTACASLFTLITAQTALSAETKEPQVEFHGYGRLGFVTNENLTDIGQDQGDSKFGVPTSRHVRDTNYLRIQLVSSAAAKSKFNIEAELDKLAHQTNDWGGSRVNLRNAYFQMPLSSETEAWVGARRLEFEDVRLFDKFPLSESTFYGLGVTTSMAGSPLTIALGAKNLSDTIVTSKDPADVSKGTYNITREVRYSSIFLRQDISLGDKLALRPTLVLNRNGQGYRKKYIFTDTDQIPVIEKDSNTPYVTGKMGFVLSHWGDAGWGNHFVWFETKPSKENTIESTDRDKVFGLASSGDYEGFSSSDLGIMYSAYVELTQFKKPQPKYSLVDGALKAPEASASPESSTSKTGSVVALAVQPVYYLTPEVHLALDLSHTVTNKVSTDLAKPAMTFITPIVRYAANKNALGTPQFYTSITYGVYETKARFTASGKPTKTSITTQTGCEFWF